MGTGNNTVEMTIRVVDGGTAAAVQKVTTELNALDGAAAKVSSSFGVAGAQAEAAGQQIAAGADTGTAGMNRLRNSAALARFEFTELGIHAPRYISSVMASSQALMGVMGALSGVFIGIAGISMFGMAIKEAKDFYDHTFSVTAALDEYRKKAAETAQKELFDTASLETTRASLADINRQLNQIETRRAAHINNPWSPEAGGLSYDAASDARRQAALLPVRDLMYNRSNTQDADMKKQQTESDKAYFDQTHKGYAKIAGDKQFDLQLSAQQLTLDRNRELQNWAILNSIRAQQDTENKIPIEQRQYVPPVPQNAGESAFALRNMGINQHAAGESIELSHKERDERIQAQNEAVNAGLRGEDVYRAKKEQYIAEILQKEKDGDKSVLLGKALIHAKEIEYDAERKKRLEDQQEETRKLQAEAGLAGATGVARIRGEATEQQRGIDWEVKNGLDPSQAAERRIAADQRADAEIEKDREGFAERVQALSDSAADREVGNYARIRSEAKRELDRLEKDFNEHTKGLMFSDPDYQRFAALKLTGQAAITGSEGAQIGSLREKDDDTTLKLETEANRKSMRPEQQKTQQIVDEYNERVRAYQKEMADEEKSKQLSDDDKAQIEENYTRRVIAAHREMNAELQAQAKETRDKLAGQLEGLFKNPRDYFKNMGTHMMAESAAAALMQLQQHMPGAAGTQSPDSSTATHGGSQIFSTIFGGGWTGHGKHGGTSMPVPPGMNVEHAGAGTMSISTATIHIDSATRC